MESRTGANAVAPRTANETWIEVTGSLAAAR